MARKEAPMPTIIYNIRGERYLVNELPPKMRSEVYKEVFTRPFRDNAAWEPATKTKDTTA